MVDAVNAMQRIVVEATGGTYFLTVSDGTSSYTTSAFAWNATAAAVATAINTAFGSHGHVAVRRPVRPASTFDGATAAEAIR